MRAVPRSHVMGKNGSLAVQQVFEVFGSKELMVSYQSNHLGLCHHLTYPVQEPCYREVSLSLSVSAS